MDVADDAGAGAGHEGRHPVPREGRDDAWWRRIYLAVIIVTVLVITGLWLFSRAYSS